MRALQRAGVPVRITLVQQQPHAIAAVEHRRVGGARPHHRHRRLGQRLPAGRRVIEAVEDRHDVRGAGDPCAGRAERLHVVAPLGGDVLDLARARVVRRSHPHLGDAQRGTERAEGAG